MRAELRPTVAADLAEIIDVPLPHRIRAITLAVGNEVLGFGGIGYRTDGTVIAFVCMKDAARKYPVALHRGGLMAMRMMHDSGVPVVMAEAEVGNAAAAPWLSRLGFRPCETAGAGEAPRVWMWRREWLSDVG